MKKYSSKTISRTFIYIRMLEDLLSQETNFVSSKQLAEMVGSTDAQIRKDISSFGRVGKPKLGYNVSELKSVLEEVIYDNIVHVVLFGAGSLGTALLRYAGFHNDRIKLVAAFESDKRKVGKEVNGVKIYAIDDVGKVFPKLHAEVGVIAVSKEKSQEVADIIVDAGLNGIINFSPTTLSVPEHVLVKNIDLSIEFMSLFYDLRAHNGKQKK